MNLLGARFARQKLGGACSAARLHGAELKDPVEGRSQWRCASISSFPTDLIAKEHDSEILKSHNYRGRK